MRYTIRLIRNPLIFIAGLSATLALTGTPDVSAATPASTITYCTGPCRMIYPGGTSQPVGPPGPLTSAWDPYTSPATITITNGWQLTEIPGWHPPRRRLRSLHHRLQRVAV